MKRIALLLILMGSYSCQSQIKTTMSDNKANPLLCDPQTGTCEIPETGSKAGRAEITSGNKPITIIYYTDPICSSCWGIEPQLRKLKLEYGDYFEIDYRMGGLLPNWSYNSGGISKPSDVAHHWDEASIHYEMPINGNVWLEDPLDSSYPSCIAMKAAQLQDKDKAVAFMRIMREKLYLDKKNIAKWNNIAEAALLAGLDVIKLKADYDGPARKLFNDDLELARKLGVRGFPTFFFSDSEGSQLKVYGSKPYDAYERALLALHPEAEKKPLTSKEPLALFSIFPTLTAKECAVILDIPIGEALKTLEKLHDEGKIDKKAIRTGALYLTK